MTLKALRGGDRSRLDIKEINIRKYIVIHWKGNGRAPNKSELHLNWKLGEVLTYDVNSRF